MALFAVKSNREIEIPEDDKQRFLNAGFDIYEVTKAGKAKLVQAANAGKVPELEAEVAALKAENEELKAAADAAAAKDEPGA